MQTIDVMLEPLRGFLQQAGAFLPLLAIAIGIVLAGWLLAKACRIGVVKALRALNFHVLTERAGIDGFLQQGGSRKDTTELFGTLAYGLILLAALMIAFSGLGLDQVSNLLGKVLLFVPRLLVALLILVFGSYFARFAGNAAQGYCRSAAIGDAELIGLVMQYVVLAFVILLAVDHLDIGGGLIQRTFLILLAGIVFGLALSFGLGARHRAAALIERWFPRDRSNKPG